MILLDRSRQAPDRKKEPRNKPSIQPDASCLRCGGLLIPDYAAMLEHNDTGKPVVFRYCVNCGNCIDLDILTNRGKGHQSARPRTRHARHARPPIGPPRGGQLRGTAKLSD